MSFLRKLEIVFGIATVLLGLAASIVSFGPASSRESIVLDLIGIAIFFVLPSSLVALGSYLHAARGNTLGFTMLLLGGVFLTGMLFIYLFGGVFYYGLWVGGTILTPSVAAVASLIASLLVTRSSIKE